MYGGPIIPGIEGRIVAATGEKRLVGAPVLRQAVSVEHAGIMSDGILAKDNR